MRFFDASALVKRYVREPDTARIRKLLRAGDVAVSRLSEIEVVSAFARLAREQAMTTAQMNRAAAAFVRDFATWSVVEITPDVARKARHLLTRHVLRAGDAIQLGAALVLQEGVGTPVTEFVAYDSRLMDAARAERLVVRAARRPSATTRTA